MSIIPRCYFIVKLNLYFLTKYFCIFFINFILKNSPEYHIFFHASIRCFLFSGQNLLKCFQKQAFSIIIVRGQITNGGIPMILSCQNICKSFGEKNHSQGCQFPYRRPRKRQLSSAITVQARRLCCESLCMSSPRIQETWYLPKIKISATLPDQDIHGHHTIYEELISTKQHIIDMEEPSALSGTGNENHHRKMLWTA